MRIVASSSASMSSFLHLPAITDAAIPLIYGAASIAIKIYLHANEKRRLVPPRAQFVGRVTQLNLFPVKSLDGIQVDEAECTSTGLKLDQGELYDRRYMVTAGDDYHFITARQCPSLLLVKTSVENGFLCFDAPGMERLRVPFLCQIGSDQDGKLTKVCGGQEVTGWDCGPEPANWFTRYLNKLDNKGPPEKYQLLFNPGIGLREINRRPHLYVNWAKSDDHINYHDDGPYLLVTESSLNELNRRITETRNDGQPVSFEHFRPAIEVGGLDIPPFDEDSWNEVYIGDVKYTVILPCGRCVFTTIDPSTAQVRQDGEPLKTLRTFRLIQSNSPSPCFGSIMVCDRPGKIRVGDNVHVLRRRTAE